MIQMPKRSVTRFFIPLIDVMTLLFCIFLLMPIVKAREDSDLDPDGNSPGQGPPQPPFKESRRLTEKERDELAQIQKEKVEALQKRLAVRVLEIDAHTGKLFFQGPERTEVASEAQARSLILRHRKEAPGRELYYLFLFPRQLTGYPLEGQMDQYQKWFAGVAQGMDNPRVKP